MHFSYPFFTTSMASVFIIFMFVFFLLWISRIFQRAASKKRVPPKAGGARPLIGHLHLLGGSEPPHITLGKMADKYGPIFTIWLGVRRTLVISSWGLAKECFTTNDKVFANRPKGVAPEVLGYNYAMIGFSPYGPFWRQVRKIATLEVLSNHRLETFKHIREAEVNDSIKEIYKLLGENNKVLVEMERWFGYTVLNVICRIVVGKRFGRATSKEENEANDRCRKTFRVFSDLSGEFMFADALPYLRWLDVGGYEKAMKKTAKEVDHMVGVWLEEHKQKKLSSELKGHQDFMDVLLSIVTEDADEFSSYDVDTIVKATSMDLILAASDTSTITLTWALSLLLNNREALTKAQEELDIQIGKDRQVKESDLKNLVYLQAIIKETMRLYPATPLLVPHESMEDCTLAGYHIPAGTQLLVNALKLQQDPNVWEDPNKFKPEKFLTTHKGVDVRGQNFELIPFGSGRRMCPGISFALQITQLTLATLLHAFEIAIPSHEPVDMTGKGGLTNQKATPLEVHLTPRFHAQIYA